MRVKKESIGNVNQLFDDLKSNNRSYYKTLEVFENKYFSTSFNTNIDEVLSKSSLESLFMHYINYIEISEIFLTMYSQENIVNLNSCLKIKNLSPIKLKLLFLLIYKELTFFSVKIEDFLNIDSKYFLVNKSEDEYILSIKVNNNDRENYNISNKKLSILKERMISYYCSDKKINSFIKFIDESYIE